VNVGRRVGDGLGGLVAVGVIVDVGWEVFVGEGWDAAQAREIKVNMNINNKKVFTVLRDIFSSVDV
jgi:hypothetical protein